jgi:hypothetical protein
MAKWSTTNLGFTPAGTADGANLTDATYLHLRGGSTTQRIDIVEARITGLAAAASATPAVLAMNQVLAVTGTSFPGQVSGAMDPASAALAAPPVVINTSTTKPQRDVANKRLALGLNAFGGIALWQAPPGLNQEFRLLGNALSVGDCAISCFTGGSPGLVMAHMIYEVL